jgi:glycosyltransferase involved in cell wall biosynthesis
LPVSVVIPVYQRQDLVGRAVRSALLQVPPPQEVIVVDDASTDATAAVAEAAGARVVRLAVNSGEGPARNAGIEAAATDWIALLDSDDEWLPGHLSRVWQAKDGFVLVSDSCISSQTRSHYGNPRWRPRVLRGPADAVWPGNPSPPSCSLFARSSAVAVGGFRPLPLAADVDFWIRLLELGPGLALPDIGCIFYEHGGNVSAGKRDEMHIAVEGLVEEAADRGWVDSRLRTRLAATKAAQQAQNALREGRRLAAITLLWRVALSPVGIAALLQRIAFLRLIRMRGHWCRV